MAAQAAAFERLHELTEEIVLVVRMRKPVRRTKADIDASMALIRKALSLYNRKRPRKAKRAARK